MAKGKLKNLFKKKEGGTVVGNLLRKAGDMATGGAYSALFPKPTAQDVANQQNKLGINTKANVTAKYDGVNEKLQVQVSNPDATQETPFWKKPIALIIGGVVLLGGLVVMMFKRKK